ncbi:MAG: PadR family transcriptional regulator [Nanoarchaeota archaeon]
MYSSHLKLSILKMLSDKPLSGYGLMSGLGKMSGKRPSSGSIYPILNELLKARTIKAVKRGRGSLFSLTKSGRRELTRTNKQREELLEEMTRQAKTFDHLFDCNISPFMQEASKHMLQNNLPFREAEKEMEQFREALIKLLQKNLIQKKEKEIKGIIKAATMRLEGLI